MPFVSAAVVAPVAAPIAGAAIASVVVGTLGVISNFLGSKKSSKAAKKQAAEEARLEGLVTDEKLRNLRTEERTVYGQTLAGFASGGVLATAPTLGGTATPLTGSPSTIIDEQRKTFADERSITRQVGASKVAQSLQHGKNVAQAYKWEGLGNTASGISNILANYSAMTN
jgi:hypothetical protein